MLRFHNLNFFVKMEVNYNNNRTQNYNFLNLFISKKLLIQLNGFLNQ